MNEIAIISVVNICQPASSAPASSAIITHHEAIRWRRLVKSPAGLSTGSSAVIPTARVSTASTPPRPHSTTGDCWAKKPVTASIRSLLPAGSLA